MSATAERTAAEELVAFFAEGWRIGASDPERFYAHFASRLTPDALMTQPLAAPARGREGLRELFRRSSRPCPTSAWRSCAGAPRRTAR